MKRKSLNHILFASMFIVGLLGILGTAYIWGALEYARFQNESKILRDEYIKTQKEEVKQRVRSALQIINYHKQRTTEQLKEEIRQRTYEAHATATFIYEQNKDKLSKAEIGKLIHDSLFVVSWNNGKGYYFAEDMQGTELINRNNPELEGTNISDLKDSKGVCIMQRIFEAVRTDGEGFCSYHWNKPGSPGVHLPKYSFVKYFKPLDWVIGNGKYLKDQKKEVQKEVLSFFRTLALENDDYYFIGTYDGVSLSYPEIGRNFFEITDVNGKKIVQELIKQAKGGGGFVSYVMPPLANEKNKNKLSYAMGVDDWEWYIGYGIYTDEIERIIAKNEQILHQSIRERTINSILLFFVLLLVALIFARSVAKNVSGDFNAFSVIIDKKNSSFVRVPVNKIHFAEFMEMAKTINGILDDQEKHDIANKILQKQLAIAQKMEAVGLVAGGVAHDLNNTLSAIINIPEYILLDMDDDDPNHDSIMMILDAGKRASAVVKDMLTIGRGVASQMNVEDLNLLINESLDSAEFQELKSIFPDINIKVNLLEKSSLMNCSALSIKKMIYNLVNNGMEAIKGKGEVGIEVSKLHIDKDLLGFNKVPVGEYYLLEISDSGCGITEDDIEKIFEPFYTRKELGRSGTGLGLAIVWNTVVDHHSFIQVESDSSGTKFSIYFPVEDISEQETRKQLADDSKSENKIDGVTILIVEDDTIQRAVLSKILKNHGHETVSAITGEEAVEMLKKRSFDLVLLDMMLGAGINGQETYKRMLEINSDQKAVIVTGREMNDDVQAIINMGAAGCIHKPYSSGDLNAIVDKALSGKECITKEEIE